MFFLSGRLRQVFLYLQLLNRDILTHLCRMYFPILINWTSPFPNLGLYFLLTFCKQTVDTLIRRRCLIWVCTVFLCPTKRTLGLYVIGLMGRVARKPVFGISDQVIPKPACSATETYKKKFACSKFRYETFQ